MALPMFQQAPTHPLSRVKHIIAIAAGKGGVGKSTVTTHLALMLKKLGHTVGVLDADVYGPSMRKMLPEDQMPRQKGETLFPALCDGVRMLSMAYFDQVGRASAVRAPVANGVITQFLQQVDWGDLDFLLIDFPPGTGDIQLTLCQQANLTAAVLVTTPQEVAVLDVRKAANLFERVRVPILGVIENMSYYYHAKTDEKIYIFGKGGGKTLAHELGTPLLGGIPLAPALCTSGDRGESLFEQNLEEGRHVERAYHHIAKSSLEHLLLLQKEGSGCLNKFELVWKEMG